MSGVAPAGDRHPDVDVDVAVVGAGPAGLAAATTCLAAGLTVALVDRSVAPGGQYWRQPAPSAAADARHALDARALRDLHHDLGTFDRLQARLAEGVELGRLRLLLRTQVWTAVREGDGSLVLHTAGTGPAAPTGPAGPSGPAGPAAGGTVRAKRLVLATGSHDLALPFPGWDLPGVLTVGALQALLKGNDVLAGRRVVVGGTGPFLLPVAAGLAARGATVVGVHEASSPTRWLPHVAALGTNAAKLGEGLAYAATLARHRVPVRTRSMVVRAEGDGRVEAVTVQRVDRLGRLVTGTRQVLAADTVGVGWGFSPIIDLAVTLGAATVTSPGGPVVRVDGDGRSSVPGVLVAGEATGVGGAALALAEGEAAAAAVVDDLAPAARAAGGRRRALARRAAALRSFAAAMHAAHPVPPGWTDALTDDTVLCRCEEVSVGAARHAVHGGADSPRQVKQLTRVGMGWCQGRVCEPACALLVAAETGADRGGFGVTERLLAQPVSLGSLADRSHGSVDTTRSSM